MMHANLAPRIIERDHKIDELVGILTSEDQRYLADGFIVTDNGRYVGLGTGDQLVRSVTETRIEAARHANPPTPLACARLCGRFSASPAIAPALECFAQHVIHSHTAQHRLDL
jgi:hypothetical protein